MTYTIYQPRLGTLWHGGLVFTLLVAACSGGDELVGVVNRPPADRTLAAIVLSPRSVVAEVHQQVRFSVYGRSPAGDTLAVDNVAWSASGGAVSPDGVFSAPGPGTYTLVATSRSGNKRGRGTVTVVSPPSSLARVRISPDTAMVGAGRTQSFAATGIASDGTVVPIGVQWHSTGGVIDAGGTYVAGPIPGSYKVIATNPSTHAADTSFVTVGADFDSPDASPATPSVRSVTISPASVALTAGATQQFTLTRHYSDGTEAAAVAEYTATGGSISDDGGYEAGMTTGTYQVIGRDASGFADTAIATITAATSGGSSDWYGHEPSGLSTVSNRSFAAVVEDGWSQTRIGRLSVVTDMDAVQSAPRAGQILYPKGFKGGYEPVVTAKQLPSGKTTLYLSFWLKFSPNFVGHPSSGVNKIFHIWISGRNRVYLSAQGAQNGRLTPQVRLQNIVGSDHFRNLTPNVNSARILRGEWQHWELVLTANTGSNRNGRAQWWIDGVKAGDYSDISYVGSGDTHSWEKVQLAPTWGGMGDTVPADQWLRIDHIYIAAK